MFRAKMSAWPLLYYPDFHPSSTWLRSVLLLVDDVKRIVPEDVDTRDPEDLKELAGELGVLSPVSPSDTQIRPIGEDLAWLERTFELIAAERKLSGKRPVSILVRKSGSIQIQGWTSLFDRKLSDQVRLLLEKNGLVNERTQKFAAGVGDMEGKTMVVSEASEAILSFIAGSIAKDTGLIATTDHVRDFAMNAMRAQQVMVRAPAGAVEGLLTGAFATVLVPKEVGQIRLQDYVIFRKASEDMRAAFGDFISKCDEIARLERIESLGGLQSAIEARAKDFEKEYKKFRRRRSAAFRAVRDWWPISVGGLLTFAKDFVPPDWALGLGLGLAGQGVKVIEKAISSNPNRKKEKVLSLAAVMDGDIKALPKAISTMRS